MAFGRGLTPSYPKNNVAMFMTARQSVLAACGMPVALAENNDGGSQGESWRRYVHGTVAPLGKLIALEAERIGLAITLDWYQLFASDIQGRARAFQSPAGGGHGYRRSRRREWTACHGGRLTC